MVEKENHIEEAANDVTSGVTNGVTDAEVRLRQAKIHVGIGLGIILFLALVLLSAAVLLLSPYHPMRIYSYTPEAEEACPNEVVPVEVDYEVDPDVAIDSMEIRAGWEAVDVEGYVPGTRIFNVRTNFDAPDDYFESGLHKRETRAPRISPNVPGVWKPVAETSVRGLSWGVPHVQRITDTEKPGGGTLTVLDASECS